MIIWESVLLLSATLIFYRLLITHLREREKHREFLEILVLSLTHKLGNFLSSQAVNLNILHERYEDNASRRLLDEYKIITEDLDQLVRITERFKEGAIKEESNIDVKTVIEKITYQTIEPAQDKRVIISLSDRKCGITAIRDEIEIVAYLLIDNAIRYSDKLIHIKLLKIYDKVLFVVRNDKKETILKGRGMGLNIVEKLCKRYKIELRIKDNDNKFTVILAIPTGILNRLISSL
jgi:light-regulated signal transduction histidine kinase (bacteriophytochrome)